MLCDSNVWLALVFAWHVHHTAARDWFDSIDDLGSIRFCRATQLSFLRLLTRAAVFVPFEASPLSNQEAWSTYRALLADDRIVYQGTEPAGLDARWREFALRDTASPKLWMDAYLAAFAQAGGYKMVTLDKAFKQFSELDLILLG